MSTNFETSVIINETTSIKLIELNKKNNDNVFTTAIHRLPGYCYVQMIISPSNAC